MPRHRHKVQVRWPIPNDYLPLHSVVGITRPSYFYLLGRDSRRPETRHANHPKEAEAFDRPATLDLGLDGHHLNVYRGCASATTTPAALVSILMDTKDGTDAYGRTRALTRLR